MKLTNQHILYLIVLVAAGLRFYNYFEIPFTHDEFSALFRTQFDSFSELIEYGVKRDGHPAGIQVFLYFWTRLFGDAEWVVKLPFVLSGIGAVYLLHRIGKEWYNETVGLLAAAFLASLQFSIFYSQIARPYTSGLFLSLLMVNYWSFMIKKPTVNFNKNLIYFTLSATLCAYNHHFSLLFAAIVGLSGLLYIQKQFLLKYILSGVVILILYVPHLSIFFHQLSMGGIEDWLAKPQNDFFLAYLAYAFHYSYLVYATIIGLVVYGYNSRNKSSFNHKKETLLFFFWFITPFLIGFFYSIYVNAIIQFSMLLFSFPFLLFVLFGHISQQKTTINLAMVLLVLCVNVFTLIQGRKHYSTTYKSPYKELLVEHKQMHQKHHSIISIIDSHKKITSYYNHQLGIDSNYQWLGRFSSNKEFSSYLKRKRKTHKYLYLGALSNNNPSTVPNIQRYFPTLVWQHNYASATSYLFSTESTDPPEAFDEVDFESAASNNWSPIDKNWLIDSIKFAGQSAYLMNEQQEYSFSFSKSLHYLLTHENNFIDITLQAYCLGNYDNISLVATLDDKDQNIYWGGSDFTTYVSDSLRWTTIIHSIKMSDIPIVKNRVKLKVYIWNSGKRTFVIDDFKITIREGNPLIYSVLEKIDLSHF